MLKSQQFLVAQLLCLASAQIVFQTSCPNHLPVVENFNVEKYLGKWYEYAKYPTNFELNAKCTTAEYSLREDGLVKVKNSMISETTNHEEFIVGNATLVENGKLLVKFPVPLIKIDASNYWVLATDYENYSVVYACSQLNGNESAVSVWILMRQSLPEPHFVQKALEILKNKNISLNQLKPTNHLSCPDSLSVCKS